MPTVVRLLTVTRLLSDSAITRKPFLRQMVNTDPLVEPCCDLETASATTESFFSGARSYTYILYRKDDSGARCIRSCTQSAHKVEEFLIPRKFLKSMLTH